MPAATARSRAGIGCGRRSRASATSPSRSIARVLSARMHSFVRCAPNPPALAAFLTLPGGVLRRLPDSELRKRRAALDEVRPRARDCLQPVEPGPEAMAAPAAVQNEIVRAGAGHAGHPSAQPGEAPVPLAGQREPRWPLLA